MPSLPDLMSALEAYSGPAVFNQYAETDLKYDVRGAAGIRRDNLLAYIEIFREAKVVLVGEAPSFHGCRFSGIPFMSEELLLGDRQLPWAGQLRFRKTSLRPAPMSEHSASIVWETLAGRRDVILWNAFPWHSHKDKKLASNRRPTKDELLAASNALKLFLGLFPNSKVFAVGRTAEKALKDIGVDALYIRHPAMGGKKAFREGLRGSLD